MNHASEGITRRAFFERGAKATAGAALAPSLGGSGKAREAKARDQKVAANQVRVALVGTGNRGTSMWGADLVAQFPERIAMVGLCDINPERVAVGRELIGVDVSTYGADGFERMIEETKPDMVIVTTTDCYHVEYAVRAMQMGCDVLSEKPLATEAAQCQRLLETEKQTGQDVKVGFNARHGRSAEEIKKILESGALGRIVSAEFEEYLNVYHGASYFRRWHGLSRYSGTLLVHKASHHFDQMNWWLGADPVRVNAFGEVAFYGSNNPFRGEKCRDCQFQDQCDFYWDITDSERYMKLYVQCEEEDGYIRDDCVWDRDIDTYDTMTAEVEYESGVRLSYSLNAFMPYEGQRIAFNGEEGRLDVRNYSQQPWEVPYEADFRLTKSFGETRTWRVGEEEEIDLGEGGHGGADGKLRRLIFMDGEPDPLGQLAGSRAGVMASLVGIAARRSIETGRQVRIRDLVDVPAGWDYWSEN